MLRLYHFVSPFVTEKSRTKCFVFIAAKQQVCSLTFTRFLQICYIRCNGKRDEYFAKNY